MVSSANIYFMVDSSIYFKVVPTNFEFIPYYYGLFNYEVLHWKQKCSPPCVDMWTSISYLEGTQ